MCRYSSKHFNMSKNKIILYMWIFADVLIQLGVILWAMAWVTQKKNLAVSCKKLIFREETTSDLWENSTATFCTQNSWVNLFYPQYEAVRQMHIIWKTVLRHGIMRPNSRSRSMEDLVPAHFFGSSVPRLFASWKDMWYLWIYNRGNPCWDVLTF